MEMKPTDVCTARGYYFFTALYMCLGDPPVTTQLHGNVSQKKKRYFPGEQQTTKMCARRSEVRFGLTAILSRMKSMKVIGNLQSIIHKELELEHDEEL
jgi:hypothetical protein